MKIKLKEIIKLSKIKHLAQGAISKEKEYLVLGIDDKSFRVIVDDGEPILIPKHIFEILDPSIPADWIKRKYKDGEYYIDPPFAAKAGFYEDLFDDKKYAVKAFHNYVIKHGYMTEEDWDEQWVRGRLVNVYGKKSKQ